MRGTGIDESVLEKALLEWFRSLGYSVLHGSEIAPGEPAAERDRYREVLLDGRLREALECLNPAAPKAALDEAQRKIARRESPALEVSNRRFHRMLADGVEVEVPAPGGGVRGELIRLVDFEDPEANIVPVRAEVVS